MVMSSCELATNCCRAQSTDDARQVLRAFDAIAFHACCGKVYMCETANLPRDSYRTERSQMKRAVDGAATARHDELSTKQHGNEPSIGSGSQGFGDITLVDGDHVVEKERQNKILFYYLRNFQIRGFPYGSLWCDLLKGLVRIYRERNSPPPRQLAIWY